MIAKLIIASLLAGTSTASVGQDAGRPAADGSTNQWPLIHQCTLDAVSKLAIKTKGTGAHRSQVGDWDGDGWSRIDLNVAGSPGGTGGPTITARGVIVKQPGGAPDRAEVTNQNPIGVDCVTSHVTGDEAAQKATMSSFTYMRADGKGVGWSCSVSGTDDKPVFRVETVIPTILGQAEPTVVGKSASWSWGASIGRASIVPRGVQHSDSWNVACSSKEPRVTNYDLAVLKKI